VKTLLNQWSQHLRCRRRWLQRSFGLSTGYTWRSKHLTTWCCCCCCWHGVYTNYIY